MSTIEDTLTQVVDAPTKSLSKKKRFRKRAPLAERFWKHVTKTGSCWVWTGCEAGEGYGGIAIQTGVKRRAHRVSYELAFGPIPDGLLVLHRCDNRRCVRPDHLFLGDGSKNMQDCISKGRMHFQKDAHFAARGSGCAQSKLTEELVKEARKRRQNGMSYPRLAKEFGVDRSCIRRAVLGLSWAHVL